MSTKQIKAAAIVGTRIREARKKYDISLANLAALATVDPATLGKLERGAQSPSMETLVRVAGALDMDPGALITGISPEDYAPRPHKITVHDLIAAQKAQAEALAAGE